MLASRHIKAISELEQQALERRSGAEKISDFIVFSSRPRVGHRSARGVVRCVDRLEFRPRSRASPLRSVSLTWAFDDRLAGSHFSVAVYFSQPEPRLAPRR